MGGVWQCWEWTPLAFLWSSKTKKRGSFKSFWSFVEESVVQEVGKRSKTLKWQCVVSEGLTWNKGGGDASEAWWWRDLLSSFVMASNDVQYLHQP